MTTFLLGLVVLTVLALITLWVPYWRRQKALATSDAQVRKQTNLDLFNERISELKNELAEGRINQDEFNDFEKELQITLLQNTEQEDHTLSAQKASIAWPVLMSVVLVSVSAYIYYDLGSHSDWQGARVLNSDPHSGMTAEQRIFMRVAELEQVVAQEPKNTHAWFDLGYSYISASQYNEAIKAFDTLMGIVGQHAELLGPKATAMYYLNNEEFTPEIQAVIDQALADDNKDPATRLLLATDAFFNANYESAIEHWEMILTSPRDDIDRQGIMGAIQQARMHLGSTTATQNPQTDAPKSLTVTIELADNIKANAQADSTIMLFARAANGSPMPVAVAQVKVSELPAKIVLDDSKAMTPSMLISAHPQVDLMATINIDGSATPTPGDMLGELKAVALGTHANLLIDTIIQ